MSTTFKWTGVTSRGLVLGSELNSLPNGAFSNPSTTAFDNTTNTDRWAYLEILLAAVSPVAGAYLQLFCLISLDGGTTYEDAAKSTNPAYHQARIAPIAVDTTASTAKHIITPEFWLPPCKVKFSLLSGLGTGVTFASTGNTAGLYTLDEQGI